jgi:DNA-binding CsgD family transcriptional regulator
MRLEQRGTMSAARAVSADLSVTLETIEVLLELAQGLMLAKTDADRLAMFSRWLPELVPHDGMTAGFTHRPAPLVRGGRSLALNARVARKSWLSIALWRKRGSSDFSRTERQLVALLMRALVRSVEAAAGAPLPGANAPSLELTERERAIAMGVAEGLGNREIAWKLSVSPETVKLHLKHIFRKARVSSRAALVARLLRNGDGGSEALPIWGMHVAPVLGHRRG